MGKYFQDPSFPVPQTPVQRMAFFASFIDLAGGLAYLHDELSFTCPERNQRFRCYHLDLKPSNILVFIEGEHLTLKFTDFGVSRIKLIRPSPLGDECNPLDFSLDTIFRTRDQAPDATSGVYNSRPGGTYAAPEARRENNKVTRKSDVWSFGAVLAVAMTYMQFDWSGIEEFAAARAIEGKDDSFYDRSPSQARGASEVCYVLDESVLTQLNEITDAAESNDHAEGIAFRRACVLIKDGILCPVAHDRWPAKQVEEGLRAIYQEFLSRITPVSVITQDLSFSNRDELDVTPATVSSTQDPVSRTLDRSRTWPALV